MRRRAFTLVELLVVIGIIAVLMGFLMPTLRRARLAAEQTACASNLRQIGAGMIMYMNDYGGHLPLVVDPIWQKVGVYDFAADPFDYTTNPQSLPAMLKNYLKTKNVYTCPSALLGCPAPTKQMSYRCSSANNYDWQTKLEADLMPDGVPVYSYSLKYLNGRKYRLSFVDPYSFHPYRLASGAGPYYLLRDFVIRDSAGTQYRPPHIRNFNQLKLDFSVSFERNPAVQLDYP